MDKVNKQELRRLAEAAESCSSNKVGIVEWASIQADFKNACSTAAILSLLDELERAESDAERLRMQLVACGVVAMCNTPDSADKARDMHPDYMSASCQDVMRAVDAEMALRAELEQYRKDALRYRWLREQEAEEGIAVLNVTGWERAATCWALTYPDAELLDSAIDAAMAKEGGANG